jgi:hypothetical protein
MTDTHSWLALKRAREYTQLVSMKYVCEYRYVQIAQKCAHDYRFKQLVFTETCEQIHSKRPLRYAVWLITVTAHYRHRYPLYRSFCCHYNFKMEFIHSSVICQTTGPEPLPKRFLHLMRSRASSFKWEYPLLSPRSSSNCLPLLPRLLVTSIRPFIFPSITSFRRQFLRKICPIQLAFRFLITHI